MAPLDPRRRTVYTVVSNSSMPIWLAMILMPRSRLTRWLVGRLTPMFVGLGLTYDVFLATGLAKTGGKMNFSDPEVMRAALNQPDIFLAGWTHYVAFDMFVGRWIWQDALDRGRTARLPLLLTWLGGPAGLSLHLLRRR